MPVEWRQRPNPRYTGPLTITHGATPTLTFTLYTADDYDRTTRHIHLDPSAVVAVEEAERRPAFGGYHQVAVITLTTGDKFIVEDRARRAAKRIAEAKQAATAAGAETT
jgi:hypothetical protein